ncbi:DDE-type integrase/transposase/recombinase [Slackia piriformis]|uniref:DDE-type integrase/transposase/recombinase n=1 Tax=Slackia piriformis TaxID=626934 RepID=UPI0032C1B7A0
MAARYRLMLEEKAEFPVSLMARVLEAGRPGFCSWLADGRQRGDWAAEREAVMRVWLESDRRFGFRFVHAMLPPDFSHLTRYRVLEPIRELGIHGCTPNAGKRTTIPSSKAGPRPDLVRRDFTSPVLAYKLAGGITRLRTGEGWLRLAAVIDLCTRIVVGRSLSDRMTADIAAAALESAKSRGYVAGNAIFHSDSKNVTSRFCGGGDAAVSCNRDLVAAS